MPNKPNLLIVGDYNRKDFLDFFQGTIDDFNFYFLEFASIEEVKNNYYQNYGKAIFWKDFSDAYDLINKIKPSKVIFYFIESYNHVALNASCKVKGIKTFHLEHGFRDYNITKFVVDQARKGQVKETIKNVEAKKKSFKNLLNRIKTQLFFFTTIIKSPFNVARFLGKYYKVRRTHLIFDAFKIVDSPFRVADTYISFSPAIFKAHKKFDHLKEDQEVFFIGFPSLDKFLNIKSESCSVGGNVIFIDQPFVKQGLLGWTKAFQKEFIDSVVKQINNKGYQLYIKKHPVDDPNEWDEYEKLNKVKLIKDDEELIRLLGEECIVLGFYSTLLLPLAALANTVLITFETHPVKELVFSEFLINSGVSEPIFNLNELDFVLDSIESYREKQKLKKQQFKEEWLYKFDNNALLRLREILIG